ncbi:Rieske (2Fe-2S) protein [Streptomyces sp. NPDC005438]|uniref:Rieske (2Fe-2S) protein n=1 Tax=Streptomyces sp. NPDC005438 TaxID=3156880 RepID=UPI0033AE661F
MERQSKATRRTVLRGVLVTGASVATGAAVAGCGSDGGSSSGDNGDGGTDSPDSGVALGSSEEVPEGGAKLYREQKVVVSRAEGDEFTGFSAVCTHRKCVLSEVKEQEGICACHGSRFDLSDGSVLKGPATTPLPKVPVRVEGGRLVTGSGES